MDQAPTTTTPTTATPTTATPTTATPTIPAPRAVLARFAALSFSAALALGACGSDGDSAVAPSPTQPDVVEAAAEPGIHVVAPEVAKAQIDAGRPDLIVLDVRTQEEYDESHLANAVLIDFYSNDFASQLAALDPTVPYVLYCRSGNRTSQTRQIMEELNFDEVYDIDGGITAWMSAGFATE